MVHSRRSNHDPWEPAKHKHAPFFDKANEKGVPEIILKSTSDEQKQRRTVVLSPDNTNNTLPSDAVWIQDYKTWGGREIKV